MALPSRWRTRDELRQQRLGGRRLALLRPALAVEGGQAVIPGELERQHAPRMAKRPPLASRPAHVLDPPLHVNLVEAERRDEGARELPSDGLPELPHRRQIGKRRRISKEVVERDQRVGLPPAVGEFELAHRLVAPPVKPVRHVLDQLPERVGRKRQREEFGRILVHRPRPRPLRHLVEVGGELRQGEFPRLQLLLEAHHLPPGRRPIRFRQVPSPRSTRSTKGYLAPPPPSAWIHTAIAATRRETRRDIRPAVRGTRVQRSHGQTPRAMVKLGQPWSKRLQATVNRRIPAHPQRIRTFLRPSVKSDPFRPGVGCVRPEAGKFAWFRPQFDAGVGIAGPTESACTIQDRKPGNPPGAMVNSSRAMVNSARAMVKLIGAMVKPFACPRAHRKCVLAPFADQATGAPRLGELQDEGTGSLPARQIAPA